MSLVKCKNCENEVSEKALSCPSCGVDLTTTETIDTDVKEIVEQTPAVVENTHPVVEDKKSKSKKPIIFGVLAVVVVVLVSLFAVQKYKIRFDKHYLEMDAQISSAMLDVTILSLNNTDDVMTNYLDTDDSTTAIVRKFVDVSYTNPDGANKFGMYKTKDKIADTREILTSEINPEYSEEYQKYINDNLEYLDDLDAVNDCLIDYIVNVNIDALDTMIKILKENAILKVINTRKDFINSFLADDEDAQAMLKEYEDSFIEAYMP